MKSKPKAAPEPAPASAAAAGPSSSEYRPQVTASSTGQNVQGYVKAYWMEDHLPEYQYTMVTNSEGNEVSGILLNGTASELELIVVHQMWKLLQNRFVSTNALLILPRV